MAIQIGDRIPEFTLTTMGEKGPVPISTNEIFSAGKVVLFSVPGAFTPPCSARPLPGFITHAADFFAARINTLAFIASNYVFALDSWVTSADPAHIPVVCRCNGPPALAVGSA